MHRAPGGLTIHISPIGQRQDKWPPPPESHSAASDPRLKMLIEVPAQPYSTPLFRKQTAGGVIELLLLGPPHCHAPSLYSRLYTL